MSNRKSKAERRERRGGGESGSTPPEGRGSRLKFIAFHAAVFSVVFWVCSFAFLVISGFGMYSYWNRTHPPKPLHTFSATERSTFVSTLKSKGVPTRSVWLACPPEKPETCALVQQFVGMFQESGWRIEGNRVVSWKPAHPLAGVYLILHAAGKSDNAPSFDAAGIRSALTTLGLPVQSASAPDVPANSIGLYFGPDL